MKILQVISYFNPKFGGDINICTNLSKQLAKRNHEVTIITTDFSFDLQYADMIRSEGIMVIPFPCVANFGRFIYSPSIKTWLEKNLMEFDVIHIHNYRSHQNVAVRSFAMRYKIPYILQAHGTVLPLFEKLILKKCFDVIWGNKILKNAAICVALTKTESDQYEKMGVPEKKIVIIPNGIDISQYEDLPLRGQFRSKYQIPENVRIILFLGRIHKIKGIDLLVSAFSQLCSQVRDVKLVIAGPDDGSLSQIQQQIRELQIENDVLYTGPLYGKDKLEAYIDADVFVLPSRYEAFPNTILEAWACGTPVIATKNCSISDVIRDTEESAVVDCDPVQMKEKILDLLSNEEKRKKIGMKGKKLVQDNFEITKLVQKIEGIYETI
jgi:glycosyltransferase involved in cell wall biosynthesis